MENDAALKFPMPFSGILFAAHVPWDVFPKVLASLSYGCGKGHAHNFAVETDASTPRIHTTAIGIACIEEVLKS